MIQLAVQVDPRFEASRLEEFSHRSYSIDTIEKVRSSLGLEDTLFFLIGADAYAEIETWHRWRDVVQAVRFIVVSRPGFHLPEAVPPPFEWIDGISLEISSSSIRRALAAGQRPHGLPPAVLQYAVSRRLYCPELS
jgi:nicotinate-nucleotide adenylyltransferase